MDFQIMKSGVVIYIMFICVCFHVSAYTQMPTWRFSVIAAISDSTAKHYGGPEAAKNLVLQKFQIINAKFNDPGVFLGHFEFAVDSVYVFTGNPLHEISAPPPDFDYRIIYDAFPAQGGGWYGSLSTIHHAWSWNYFGGVFGSTATDGVVHEFGHSRGAIDLYAIQVSASNNPINGMAYEAEKSIMNYPYGETIWDEHTIHIINRNADSIPKVSSYITAAFPDTIMLNIYDAEGFPAGNAEIFLYPISWYSNSMSSSPSHSGLSDLSGTYRFPGNPYEPATLNFPWHIKYPNFLLHVKTGEKEYYRFMPFTEVQNFYFNNGNCPFVITLGEAYQPLEQTISFSALDTCIYGDPDFMLAATSSSGLPVSFVSSDSNIIHIDSNRAYIKNAGRISITARQAGNKYYCPALPVIHNLVVNKAQLNIMVSDTSKVYGEENPDNNITYFGYVGEDNMDSIDVLPSISCIATRASCAGTYSICADSASDNNYSFTYTHGLLCINKRTLFAAVPDTTKVYGDPNPDFTIIYDEFVGNDIIDSLNTIPITHCDADEFTDAGQFEITLTGGSDNNYEVSCNNGTLWILKADQEIRFDSIYPVTIDTMPFELTAYATSGLEIEYTSSNPHVAFISGNTISVMHAGTTVISANQYGNKNYNAARQIQYVLLVQESTVLDRKDQAELLIYPNPASNELYIMNKSGYIEHVKLYNAFGSLLIQLYFSSNFGTIDITNLTNGIYMLEIISEKTSLTVKVLVNNIR